MMTMNSPRMLLLVEPDLNSEGRAMLQHLLQLRAIPPDRYQTVCCPAPTRPRLKLPQAEAPFHEYFARRRGEFGAVIGLGGQPCELLTGTPRWWLVHDRAKLRGWLFDRYGRVWIAQQL